MPEEQRRILEMLASKQITVEQADRLLEAVTPRPLRDDTSPQPRPHNHQHQHQPRRTHATVNVSSG